MKCAPLSSEHLSKSAYVPNSRPDIVNRKKASGEAFAQRLLDEVWDHRRRGAIDDSSGGSRDWDGSAPRPFALGNISEMRHHAGRKAQSSSSPLGWQSQVGFRWECVRESVQRERRPVRKQTGPLAPEPHGNQVFVITRGKVDEAVLATAQVGDAAGTNVLCEKLAAVSRLGSLRGREEPLLGRGAGVEGVPTGRIRFHATM